MANQYVFDQGSLSYNTPDPMTGVSAYGKVPGLVDIPPSLYEQISSVYSPLAEQAGLAGRNITAGLMGEVSPEALYALHRNAARFGTQSGMPLSGLQSNMGLLSLGQTAEANAAKAQQEYESLTRTMGSLMTPQDLAARIAERNATMAAAPDPEAAAKQQMADWMEKFHMTQAATAPGRAITGGPGAGIRTATGLTGADASADFGRQWISTPAFQAANEAAAAEAARAAAWQKSLGGMSTYNLPTGSTYGGGAGLTDEEMAAAQDPLGYYLNYGDVPQSVSDFYDLGAGDQGSEVPAGTTYNPVADTSEYNYGLESWLG